MVGGGLHRRQPAQPVGMALDGQVQRRVRGMQVGVPFPPIGQASDRDHAEHRPQRPTMAYLDAVPDHPVGARHPLLPRIARCARRSTWS
jgi:hypothetical protein